jgi:hypothetical protein
MRLLPWLLPVLWGQGVHPCGGSAVRPVLPGQLCDGLRLQQQGHGGRLLGPSSVGATTGQPVTYVLQRECRFVCDTAAAGGGAVAVCRAAALPEKG